MANFSRVTNKKYIRLKETGESVSGWYIGGALNTSKTFGTRNLTVHLLQEDGEVIGVNMTAGYTKQFLKGNDLTAALGKFVELRAGEAVPTKRGKFIPINTRVVPAKSDMPAHPFELTHAVDYDNLKLSGAGPAPSITTAKEDDLLDADLSSEEVSSSDLGKVFS